MRLEKMKHMSFDRATGRLQKVPEESLGAARWLFSLQRQLAHKHKAEMGVPLESFDRSPHAVRV